MNLLNLKNLLYISALLILSTISSCHPDNDERFEHASGIPVIIRGDSLWSMYGINGNFKFENRLKQYPSLVIDGHFSMINSDGSYSLYKLTDKPELIKGCGRLTSVGYYNEGLIPVSSPGSRIRILDMNGNVKFELKPYNGEEIRGCANTFFNGLLRILTPSGKYGFVNKKGQYIIKPIYSMARDFSEGLAVVETIESANKNHSGEFSVINTNGEIQFTLDSNIFLQTYHYHDGRLVAIRNGRLGFIDRKGRFTTCMDSATGIGQYDKDFYVFSSQNGLWGVADYKGNIIIKPYYKNIEILPAQTFLVEKKDNRYLVLDRMDNIKINFKDADQVKYFKNLGFLVHDNKGISLRNTNGVRICDKYFSDVSLEKTVCSFIRSEIFKELDLFKQFIASLTTHGIGIFELNAPISTYLNGKDISEYIFSKQISSDKIFYENEKSSYRFTAFTDCIIAGPDRRNPKIGIINQKAKIIAMKLEIHVSSADWATDKMVLSNNLHSKGFNLMQSYVKEDMTYKLYQSINSELIIEENPSENIVTVYLMAGHGAKKFRSALHYRAPRENVSKCNVLACPI